MLWKMRVMDWWRRDNRRRCSVPPGPCSICRMVSPEGEGQLEILLWMEGVAVIRGVNGSDSRVHPEDASVAIPGVSLMPWEDSVPPLLSTLLSRSIWSICGPQLGSGVSCFVALCGFEEDLDEDIFVCCLVEGVELTLPTR